MRCEVPNLCKGLDGVLSAADLLSELVIRRSAPGYRVFGIRTEDQLKATLQMRGVVLVSIAVEGST